MICNWKLLFQSSASSFKNELFFSKKDEACNCKCNQCQSQTDFPQVFTNPWVGATPPGPGGIALISSKISEEWRLPWDNTLAPDLPQGNLKASIFLSFTSALAWGQPVYKQRASALCLVWRALCFSHSGATGLLTGGVTGDYWARQRPGGSSPPFQVSSQWKTTVSQGLLFPWEKWLVKVKMVFLLYFI